MEIEHEFLEDLNVIKVKHKVVFSGLKHGDLMNIQIQELSKQYNCNRFLLDAGEMKLDNSFIDTYYLAEHFEKLGFKKDYRIAFIYSQDDDLYLFLELVLQNRGYAARFFKDEPEALEWLTNGW
jgi:hypothetical protein